MKARALLEKGSLPVFSSILLFLVCSGKDSGSLVFFFSVSKETRSAILRVVSFEFQRLLSKEQAAAKFKIKYNSLRFVVLWVYK